VIQEYDRELYAKKVDGRIDIFRRTYEYVPYEVDDVVIHIPREVPYRVFCLTDSWKPWGKPVDWGIEPILAKLRRSDLWKRDLSSEFTSHNEKIEEAEARHRRNETEAFLLDRRSEIAKAWGDINTSILDKKTDRRYRDDRKIKKG